MTTEAISRRDQIAMHIMAGMAMAELPWDTIAQGAYAAADALEAASRTPPNRFPETELARRIALALDRAAHDGCFDGGHHKAYAIDQMVRALCGGDKEFTTHVGVTPEYTAWVAAFEAGEDGPQTYKWDTGIPG